MSSWSPGLIALTRQALEELALVPGDDKVYLKNIDGSFGYLLLQDVLQSKLSVHQRGQDEVVTYATVDDLIEAGWALD